MGIILSLLLALSLNQAEIENARLAQEANTTNYEQQVKIEMLSKRVARLKQEKLELIHSNKELKKQVETKAKPKIEITKVNNEAKQVKSESQYETYTITWYTADYESTQKTPSDPDYKITASGTTVKQGRTLACPKSLEFGTKVYIKELDHTYTCEDRGGAIKSGRLDIYIDSLKQALKNGKQKMQVRIIKDGA